MKIELGNDIIVEHFEQKTICSRKGVKFWQLNKDGSFDLYKLKWQDTEKGDYRCPCCDFVYDGDYICLTNHCPNCGIKLRWGDED